jgi:N-formylglutamate amidohydrolase
VTHAGRHYPKWVPDRLAVPMAQVRPLEDRHADVLVERAIADGWRTLIARTPRLLIDLNRAETDFEARAVTGARNPAPRPSHRARGGLGLVPERLGTMQLWRHPITAADLAERVVAVHRPWHAAIDAALTRALAANGRAVLLDIHSMPSLSGAHAAQIVIGNRHGGSADAGTTQAAVIICRRMGLRVAVNAPYAGAYMLERHGRPAAGIAALQIEVDRAFYLDSALDGPGRGVTVIQALVAELAATLGETESRAGWPLAAE